MRVRTRPSPQPDRLPAGDAMEPHQPPAEASEAVHAAALAAGLAVAPHELRPLLRALGGRPPASDRALRAALLGIRRRAWRDRLGALAQGAEALPARPDDLAAAVASIADPDAGDAALLGSLREAVLARLAGYGAPDTALAAALEDLPKGTSGQPTLEAVEHCAMLVAEAFALPGADAAAFARRAAEAERRRRGERRAAARAARDTRAEEERRLKAWEASLVGAEAVPGLLGCGREEAERWIRARRVPVARRVEVRRGARTVREPEFDPAALEALRCSVRAWREADDGSGDGPPAVRHEARTGARRTSNAAVA